MNLILKIEMKNISKIIKKLTNKKTAYRYTQNCNKRNLELKKKSEEEKTFIV